MEAFLRNLTKMFQKTLQSIDHNCFRIRIREKMICKNDYRIA